MRDNQITGSRITCKEQSRSVATLIFVIIFIQKYRLPFILLSDPGRKVMTKYGAFGEKMMYGKKTVGVIRSTVWVGSDGKVKKHWKRVAKAADHPAKVLEALQGK